MEAYDALKVAELIAKADGGCPYCVAILIENASRLFPGHDWKALVRFVNPEVLKFPDEEKLLQDRAPKLLQHSTSFADGRPKGSSASGRNLGIGRTQGT